MECMQRREILALLGSVGVASIAGCSSGDSGGGDQPANTAATTQTTAQTTTPSPTPTATKTPSTPVPTAAPGELPTKEQFRAQYTRFTEVEQSSAEVELVGSDIRTDFDADTGELVLVAAKFLSGREASGDQLYDRITRGDVSIPAEGERRRLTFDIELSGRLNNPQYQLFVRESGASLSEAVQLCESEVYTTRLREDWAQQPGLARLNFQREDRSEGNYRRFATEGYRLIAVKSTTLDGREFVFEYPVFVSAYQAQKLRTDRQPPFDFRGAHEYNRELPGYRRALQQAADSSDGRQLLLTGLAVLRSLPDIPQVDGDDRIRTLEQALVEAGPTKAGVTTAMTAAAALAGYDVAVLESPNTVAPGIVGDFSGVSVDLVNGTSYYYVEPAARSAIGENPYDFRQDFLSPTPPL